MPHDNPPAPKVVEQPKPKPPPVVPEEDPNDVLAKKRRQQGVVPGAGIVATILSQAIGGGRETLG